LWLFLGILIGLIISGIFYVKNQKTRPSKPTSSSTKKIRSASDAVQSQPQTSAVSTPNTPNQNSSTQNTGNTQKLETQFDFYHALATPSKTTPPPLPSAPTPSKSTITAPAASTGSYIVQVAALSKVSDVDPLKAQLLLLGFDVHVTPLTQNNKVLQRVWIGPFSQKSKAASVQTQLKENQISSAILKSNT
jgi:cell division protein FtsN